MNRQIIENCSYDEIRKEASKKSLPHHALVALGYFHEKKAKQQKGDFTTSYKFCSRCGFNDHISNGEICPAKFYFCTDCCTQGHFEHMCLTKKIGLLKRIKTEVFDGPKAKSHLKISVTK